MALVVAIEPGYSSHNTQVIEICTHCNRPLCPHCWNHSVQMSEDVGLWVCSNEDCKLTFHYHMLEDL